MTPRDAILRLLADDAAPCDARCGILLDIERTALIHILNGGNLDVSLGTDSGSLDGTGRDGD